MNKMVQPKFIDDVYGDNFYEGAVRVENCSLCNGYGYDHKYGTCYRCDGIGQIAVPLLDKCERCCGAKGGMRGNENRIGNQSVCDYCHYEIERGVEKQEEK